MANIDYAGKSTISLLWAKVKGKFIAQPSGGSTGQVLTKTATATEWADPPSIPSPLPISQGGTGATTAEGARTALGVPDIEVATDEEFDAYMGLSSGGA